MFTSWPPRLTQSDPSERKYANIFYIYNKNLRRHARQILFYFIILFPALIE